MPKDEVPSRSEQEADECLHCAIIDMVDEKIEAQLMAHTLAALGDLFIQKSGGDGGGSGSTH